MYTTFLQIIPWNATSPRVSLKINFIETECLCRIFAKMIVEALVFHLYMIVQSSQYLLLVTAFYSTLSIVLVCCTCSTSWNYFKLCKLWLGKSITDESRSLVQGSSSFWKWRSLWVEALHCEGKLFMVKGNSSFWRKLFVSKGAFLLIIN